MTTVEDILVPDPHDADRAPAFPSTPAAWGAVAILFMLSILSMLDRNLVSLLVVDIKRDLAIGEVEAGTLLGVAFALFYAIGALPLGWALDRYSRPKVIWFGVTLWSLGTIACGLARNFTGFFAARAVVGGGEAALIPGTYSLLPDLFPRHRLALPMSVYSMSSKIGAGASLAIGGLLTTLIAPASLHSLPVLGTLRGWQLVFILAGVPGLLLALVIFLVRDPRRARGAPRPVATSFADYGRYAWRNRRFLGFHHGAILPLTMLIFGIYAWLPAFYMRVHHLSAGEVGARLGLAISVGPVLALPFHGWAADRWFRSGRADAHLRYLIAALALATPLIVASFLVTSATASFVLVGLFFMVVSAYLSLPTVALQLVLPAELRGKSASVILMINGIVAAGGGPVLVAALSQWLGGPEQVGKSLMLLASLAVPLTAFLYLFALTPLRRLLAEQETARPSRRPDVSENATRSII
jgi:MFS family permease